MINEQLDKAAGGLITNNVVCVVVDNNDPEKRKRIKIRAPFLHDEIIDDDLPWACPYDYTAWGNGAGDIMFIPKVGTEVLVDFSNGVNNPVYVAKIPTTNKQSSLASNPNYPNVWGLVDANGNEISFDEVAKLLKLLIDGDIEIKGNNLTINLDGATVNLKNGTVNGDDITVNAKKLKLPGNVAPTGSGPFCAVKNCLFSGAPHVGDTVTG